MDAEWIWGGMMREATADRILVPVDFSPCSTAALEHASFLQIRFGSDVFIVHTVVRVPELSDGETFVHAFAGDASDAFRQAAILRAKRDLDVLLSTLGDLKAKETYIDVGRPTEVILRIAEAIEADLIVMGTHGRSGFHRLAMGSVAESVLREAACPVLIVPSPQREPLNAYA
ncbi:MAG: universal stress protein [Deltaproteobacteria bacterium]|nr:universal stress protein [Deltaproteobacteria bacterium]